MSDLKNSITGFSFGVSAFDVLRQLIDAFGVESVRSALDELDNNCKHKNIEPTIYGPWCLDYLEFVGLK